MVIGRVIQGGMRGIVRERGCMVVVNRVCALFIWNRVCAVWVSCGVHGVCAGHGLGTGVRG